MEDNNPIIHASKRVSVVRADGSYLHAQMKGAQVAVDLEELTDAEMSALDEAFGTKNGRVQVTPEVGDQFRHKDGRLMVVTGVDVDTRQVSARSLENRHQRRRRASAQRKD